MQPDESGGQPINSYALVSYIPDPLGPFLNQLRIEMLEGCTARAHVTVLPPRPLVHPAEEAWQELVEALEDTTPFLLDTTAVEIFPVSSVIYLGIGNGFQQVKALHALLNRSKLAFQEPFPFHPHITLAQGLNPDRIGPVATCARQRWAGYCGPRSFPVRSLEFVQNTIFPETGANCWINLGECPLRPAHRPAQQLGRND
ncbi:MAG: 2'-5' RNA ligase family protein [Bryobacteraceae bacterium]